VLLSTSIIIKKNVSVKNTQTFLYEVEKQKNQKCVTYCGAVAVTDQSLTRKDAGKHLT
jgi:hypothetical protein